MILECEMCATRYLVDTSDIGVLGRMVRCAECGHDWYATTDGAKPSPQPAPVSPPKVETTQSTEPPVAEAVATGSTNLPAIVPKTNDRAALMVLFWGGMVLALVVLYLVFGRSQIMAVWPPAQHAFAVLGLEDPVVVPDPTKPAIETTPALFSLQNMQIERIGGTVTLTGFVRNDGGVAAPLPSLTIVEYGESGNAVSTIDIALEAGVNEITPGESVPIHLVHGLADPAIARVRVAITEGAVAP